MICRATLPDKVVSHQGGDDAINNDDGDDGNDDQDDGDDDLQNC